MSGAQVNVAALDFNSGFGLPYTVFTPVYWAPVNTSGVSGQGGAINQGSGITPGLLASAQDNLASIAQTGLNTITFSGLNNQAFVGGLLQNWGNTLQQIAQQNADALTTSIGKSARACSGFFSCLFG